MEEKENLPPLSEPFDHMTCLNGAATYPNDPIEEVAVYTADQLREYGDMRARMAREEERERCAQIAKREAKAAWEAYDSKAGAGGDEYTEAEASSETSDRIAAAIRKG